MITRKSIQKPGTGAFGDDQPPVGLGRVAVRVQQHGFAHAPLVGQQHGEPRGVHGVCEGFVELVEQFIAAHQVVREGSCRFSRDLSGVRRCELRRDKEVTWSKSHEVVGFLKAVSGAEGNLAETRAVPLIDWVVGGGGMVQDLTRRRTASEASFSLISASSPPSRAASRTQ